MGGGEGHMVLVLIKWTVFNCCLISSLSLPVFVSFLPLAHPPTSFCLFYL